MPDILDEVEEDLRRDRFMRIWQRFGWILGAIALVIVVGVAGWRIWQWYDLGEREAAAERFLAAARAADPASLQAGGAADPGAARASFEALVAQSPSGYATLARMRAAGLAAQAGDAAGAEALWLGVVQDTGADPLLRDLARLALVRHRMGRVDPAALAAELAPMAAPGQPFRASALELQALLAEARGSREEALARLRELAEEPNAPPSLRARAGELRARLGG